MLTESITLPLPVHVLSSLSLSPLCLSLLSVSLSLCPLSPVSLLLPGSGFLFPSPLFVSLLGVVSSTYLYQHAQPDVGRETNEEVPSPRSSDDLVRHELRRHGREEKAHVKPLEKTSRDVSGTHARRVHSGDAKLGKLRSETLVDPSGGKLGSVVVYHARRTEESRGRGDANHVPGIVVDHRLRCAMALRERGRETPGAI